MNKNKINKLVRYFDQLGGVFTCEEYEVLPYNHWRKDNEWLVLICHKDECIIWFINALSARDAAFESLQEYLEMQGKHYE